MGKRSSVILGIVILIALIFSASAVLAECPEGKSEVQITTPSGRQNIICVPDTAISGIENAAEHSPTTIVPGTCPCWSEEEFQLLQDRNPDLACRTLAIRHCEAVGDVRVRQACTTSEFTLLELGDTCGDDPGWFCSNSSSTPVIEKLIGEEEYLACLTIIGSGK